MRVFISIPAFQASALLPGELPIVSAVVQDAKALKSMPEGVDTATASVTSQHRTQKTWPVASVYLNSGAAVADMEIGLPAPGTAPVGCFRVLSSTLLQVAEADRLARAACA